MSDYAIPDAGTGPVPGEDRVQTRSARAAQAPPPVLPDASDASPADAPGAGEAEDLDALARSADGAASLRMLLETAVARRSVDEIADLVTLLRGSGQLPEGADQALRAAAVSRPIEDVISLAVLLAGTDGQYPHTAQASQMGEPEQDCDPQQKPHHQPPRVEPETAAPDRNDLEQEPQPATPDFHQFAGLRPGEGARARASGSVLRWPAAVTLAVSALLYVPRLSSGLSTGGPAWLLLGMAGVCLVLGVLLVVGDRTWVWSTTTLVGIGLVMLHGVTAATDVNLLGVAVGGLLPWPTGASMLAAGLTAVLAVMALLYRSDRPHSSPVPDLAGFESPDADARPPVTPHEPTAELASEARATAP